MIAAYNSSREVYANNFPLRIYSCNWNVQMKWNLLKCYSYSCFSINFSQINKFFMEIYFALLFLGVAHHRRCFGPRAVKPLVKFGAFQPRRLSIYPKCRKFGHWPTQSQVKNELFHIPLVDFQIISFIIIFIFCRSFRQKIVTNKMEKLYQSSGQHTFFIPVEEGFKVLTLENCKSSIFILFKWAFHSSLHHVQIWLTRRSFTVT